MEKAASHDSIQELNQALYDEFVRITGRTSRYEFAPWIAQEQRNLRVRLHGYASNGAHRFRRLRTPIFSAMLVGHLRAQPPANWPGLHLA